MFEILFSDSNIYNTNATTMKNNSQNIILNPNWVIGFVDAVCCFRISIIKNKNIKGKALPLSVRLYFQIGLHRKDEAILELIASELGVGKIYRAILAL